MICFVIDGNWSMQSREGDRLGWHAQFYRPWNTAPLPGRERSM